MIMIPIYHYNKEEPKTGLKQTFYSKFDSARFLVFLTKIEKIRNHHRKNKHTYIPIFRARNFLLNFLHI